MAFQQRPQGLPGLAVAGVPGLGGLLEIHDAGVFFQSVGDAGGPQGVLGQLVHQLGQGGNVHPQLVGVLVPEAEGAAAHAGAQGIGMGVAQSAGQHRPGGALSGVGVVVAGVHLKQQVKGLAALGTLGENVVTDIVVGDGDPLGPAGAEGLAVYKQGSFAPQIQRHGHGLALQLFRQPD